MSTVNYVPSMTCCAAEDHIRVSWINMKLAGWRIGKGRKMPNTILDCEQDALIAGRVDFARIDSQIDFVASS